MACEDETVTVGRTPGRRIIDNAHLVKWVPFISLLFLMLLQTIGLTRYISGIETSNAQLLSTVAELKAELKALTNSVNQSAIPSAQTTLRLEYLEARLNEMRASANENSRRLTALEAQSRSAARER